MTEMHVADESMLTEPPAVTGGPPVVSPPAPGVWSPDEAFIPGAPGAPTGDLPDAARTGVPTDPPIAVPPSGRVHRFVRGRPEDPVWVRPALFALLMGTGILYLWGLGASGWGNSFYAAAVQAGTKSWKAFFFGSFDGSNFITVDKPPASLWVMEISARIFGVNAWSLLVPQALEGVATVGILYATVRRWFTPGAALLAGAVLALTPVATLMFRFNNPDALLTLVLTGAAYATFRAVEDGRSRWMVLAGTLVGFGFITKMLQAIIIIPILALVYLLAGPPKLGRRVVQVVYLGVATVVAGGWWVAAVQLTPAVDRPYVGGSTDNNLLNLIFGYNGFGRLTGNETGSVGGGFGGGGGGSMWGPVGWNRLFLREMGGQVSWLIPGALIGLLAALWMTRRAPRTDRVRAGFLVFGGWLLLTGAVLSFAHGIIHPYYTIVLAPAIGALVGMGGVTLWKRRQEIFPRLALVAAILATVAWAFVMLGWSPHWYPALRWAILAAGALAALGIAAMPRARGVLAAGIASFGIASIVAAPAAYSLDTAGTPHSGAIPSAGPAVQGASGFPGGFGGAGGRGNAAGNGITLPPGFTLPNGAKIPSGSFRGGGPGGAPGGPGGGRIPGGFGGAGGGLLDGSTPSKALTSFLATDASRYTWVAATTGANSAAGYQLATGDAVMAIGGFNGTDPAPSLAQFQKYVAEGKIHYFISGGGGFGGLGGGQGSKGTSDATRISTWVSSHFTAKTVGGVTVYDLTTPNG
jgi:4-amino-4-deoxy-L-arabinose transferase-like glycosyltransferase